MPALSEVYSLVVLAGGEWLLRHTPWRWWSQIQCECLSCQLSEVNFRRFLLGGSVGLSDLSITLLCDSDEVLTPVNSDQVLSDVDLPLESVSHGKRQVIRIRDSSPDVQVVDASQVGRAWDSQQTVSSVASGKCMPGKESMAISRAPLSLDMTVTCSSGVAPMSAHPPAVTSIPAMSTATITSGEIDVNTRSSDVAPVPRLEPESVPVGESVPAVELSSPPLSEKPVPVPVVESVPAVYFSSSPLSGQSSPASSRMLAWGDAGDSSVPLSPNRVQAGRSRDVPEEGSLFHVSPVLPGFLFRPSRADQQFPPDGVLLPTTLDDFSDSVLGDPITYAQCEQIPGSDTPMSLPVYSLPSESAYMHEAVVGSDCVGFGDLLSSGGGVLRRRSYYGYGGQPVAGDGPARLSISVHVVQWTAVLGWESSVWLAASSPVVPGSGVGSPIVLFTNVLGRSAWRGTSDSSSRQPAAGRGHNVVQSSDTVAVRSSPHVVRNDGPRYTTDGVSSGRGR